MAGAHPARIRRGSRRHRSWLRSCHVFRLSILGQGGALQAKRGAMPDAAASTRAGRAAYRPIPARRAAAPQPLPLHRRLSNARAPAHDSCSTRELSYMGTEYNYSEAEKPHSGPLRLV